MKHMTRLILAGLIAGVTLAGVGCRSTVPERARHVGGGFDMQYTAPTNGIIYLVDTEEHSILLSRSVQQSDQFRYFEGKAEFAGESFDVDYKGKARDLKLYFEPAVGQPFRWR
jgi:hypothetical protein